ncbi:40S ribosomal S10-like protein, putative [Medicago truncatula]|uniref:40S ribosomal S10-like protein, putative n=1 Tax=Medicago truncatula TaxID=3880 RepID=A0A072UAY7_MEDTR|nr:40S ribosomal S10-like protein, putative [Medicago truncatula]
MTDLFSVCIRFNGGNPQMFKVRYINGTLKYLTRRVKYICYERPTFSRLELKNDDDVMNMFSIFWQQIMVSWIDMFVTLQRSTEDILNSLIPPKDRD